MYSDRLVGAEVCVVDMTHGGIELCEALVRRGATPVAVDVHATLCAHDVTALGAQGISIFRSFSDMLPLHAPDLVIMQYAPDREAILRHCGHAGIPLMTHAKATGLMLRERMSAVKTAEITGARGKSTVMGMLASIMAHTGEPSLFMTSTGAFLQHGSARTVIDRHGSITPAHALSVVDAADEAGCPYSHCFFEVSLGGLGIGNVCSILAVPLELKAGIGRSAFFSKAQMAELSPADSVLNVCAQDRSSSGLRFLSGSRYNLVGNGPASSLFSYPDRCYPGCGPLRIHMFGFTSHQEGPATDSFSIVPAKGLFGAMAADNILAAAGIALALGIAPEAVSAGIETYVPLPRRMEYSECGGTHHVRNNAPTKETALLALDEALRFASCAGMPAHAVIGGRTKTSCGTIDLRGLAEGINARRESFASISLFGQLGADLVGAGCTSPLIPLIDDAGISAMGVPGTVVVSCVN